VGTGVLISRLGVGVTDSGRMPELLYVGVTLASAALISSLVFDGCWLFTGGELAYWIGFLKVNIYNIILW